MHDAVVVGFADKPAVVVESLQTGLSGVARLELAKQIVQRLAPFNERLFLYEVSTLFIRVYLILLSSGIFTENR